MVTIHFVTVFPGIIHSCLNESMFRKALENGCVAFHVWDLRDFTSDRHRQVDDIPYGGGAGMVLKPEPFFRAFERIRETTGDSQLRVIFPSPQGRILNHRLACELATENVLVFFCGHYKGVDERVIEHLVSDEISIGDYILTGGELPALVIADSLIRHIPGVLHSYESAATDSFTDNLLEGPIYTRPQEFQGMTVPEVLLSGHHAQIETWRNEQRLKRTTQRRKDLINDNR